MAKNTKRGRRHDDQGRSRGKGYFGIDRWVMDTKAFQSLTPAQRAVYLELEYRYNGSNNGSIRLSCREAAARCGINKDTAAQALSRLAELGFVKVRMRGAFSLKARHASEYELTRHPVGDRPASKEFVYWSEKKPVRKEGHHGPRNPDKTGQPATDGRQSVPPIRTVSTHHGHSNPDTFISMAGGQA